MKRYLLKILIICAIFIIPDYAQEWVNICPEFIPENIYGLDGTFKNKNEGWIIGIGELPQKLYRTSDGGNSWEVQMSIDSLFYSNITFVDNCFGWMKISKWIGPHSNYEHYLYKTKNGGLEWNQVDSPPDSAFLTFTFIDSITGFSGGNNIIFFTQDGGETWQSQYIDSDISLGIIDFYFIDNRHGWASGANNQITDTGIILNTVTGGDTWRVNVKEAGVWGSSLYFINRNRGFVVGSNPPIFQGAIMKTRDGGETWETEYLPCSWLRDVVFINDSTGWIVGDYGFIWHTADTGNTWQKIESGTDADLNSIVFVDNGNVGYIFGEHNTLLKYDKTGNSVIYKPLSTDQFILNQNFPNPFNAETVIKYRIDKNDNVVLIVYDLSGKEVISLVNEKNSPGNHQVIWNGKDNDGNDVSSGIYFYELRTDSQKQVYKMILIH